MTSEASHPRRQPSEHSFVTDDGTELFFRSWKPTQDVSDRRAIILFHRGHEHSQRWQDLIDRIDLPDYWFFAWDARGHGRSPGERGYADSFGRVVRDADEFVRHVSNEFEVAIGNMAVVAQSVGAVIASTWVHDYAPAIRALVIATPAFQVRLYVPLAIPGLRLLQAIKPRSFIRSYVKPGLLTHDREQAKLYAEDPLISPQIAVNILLGLFDTSRRVIQDAGAIITPTLLLVSGSDWVVEEEPQFRFLERVSSLIRERILYPRFFHSTFWEQDRAQPIAATREFILRQFNDPLPVPSLLNADQSGYTRFECDNLRRRLSIFSPKRWFFFAQWLGMQTLGRLSAGIRIGWKTGFDSGESLDHVYRNTPAGFTPIGKLIDRTYLNSPGWRGIRQRKVHMIAMLEKALAQCPSADEAVHIVDVAAGPGRYLLEFIQRHTDRQISATLRDRSETGLAAGRELAAQMELTHVTYESGDAFDAEQLASLSPRPKIAIVSGLYELFPENTLIRNSLNGLARAVPAGGILLYTNQPWHPQHEMIARVLPNRDGDPWVMRCRSQAEMDQLVAAAGFDKIDMLIDDDGIFSVSMAVRRVD
ncbi:MAG: bifunctional alpha/beta hydrolase/class I SAM-dependent methyltransferase [Planctomycetaceae bacterium]|nr:bifunctional alpha/beta hydrolase/class I SAM-dependent methyltransferase [Planctomycetaceae bacterium]